MCRPSLDTLPHIDAALVTGITPQQAEADGVLERDFFAAIHSELARPGTCGVGYNSIRFDDEVTRYGFYRNFYDPYAREWQGGNSRWDIIDMVRLCHAVRPDGIVWPPGEGGTTSFRLEKLTEANNISHKGAHDALSDVYATIDMARLIKKQQPRLYQHILELRAKTAVQQALELGSFKPKLHISSRISATFACASLVVPLAVSPKNKNEIICVDLRYSPQPLFDLSAEEIIALQFTAVADLPDGIERIPLKTLHLNRCPVVLSPALVDPGVSEKIQLDLAMVEKHRQQIIAHTGLAKKLTEVYRGHKFQAASGDVDAQLYDGFIPQADKNSAREITQLSLESIGERRFYFEDPRLNELYFRYRARNLPENLNNEEKSDWQAYCASKLLDGGSESLIGKELARIRELKQQHEKEPLPRPDALQIVEAIEVYLQELQARLSS